jgi:hypothetical protein
LESYLLQLRQDVDEAATENNNVKLERLSKPRTNLWEKPSNEQIKEALKELEGRR